MEDNEIFEPTPEREPEKNGNGTPSPADVTPSDGEAEETVRVAETAEPAPSHGITEETVRVAETAEPAPSHGITEETVRVAETAESAPSHGITEETVRVAETAEPAPSHGITEETVRVAETAESAPSHGVTEEKWYVDLNKEEFVAFRMLTARLTGPLRQRIPTLVMSLLCFVLLGGYALFEWLAGWVTSPDPVLLVGSVLVLIPTLIFYLYVPYHLRRNAEKQYDRSVEAGMDYFGELTVYPDCIEKVGRTATARIRIDERTLMIETAEMMVLSAVGSPAIVLPARCLTDEMARAVRQTAEGLPVRNRRFLGRVQPKGERPTPPAPRQEPQELWVNTFTYTAEEYAVVLRGIIQQHFWRMAPLLAAVSMMGALAFGYNGESLLPCIGYFVVFIALLIVFNLVLPLHRAKTQTGNLSAHDLTVQVRIDTMALRMKLPKGTENWVLWCDVDHVYERDDFVEIVHNKHSSLFIPKRCIADMDALDEAIKQCRGEQ